MISEVLTINVEIINAINKRPQEGTHSRLLSRKLEYSKDHFFFQISEAYTKSITIYLHICDTMVDRLLTADPWATH